MSILVLVAATLVLLLVRALGQPELPTSLDALLTVTGAGAATVGLMQLAKRTFPTLQDRWMPALAVGLGVCIVLVVTLIRFWGILTADLIAQAILTGAVAGFTSNGMYDNVAAHSSKAA